MFRIKGKPQRPPVIFQYLRICFYFVLDSKVEKVEAERICKGKQTEQRKRMFFGPVHQKVFKDKSYEEVKESKVKR